MEIKKLAKFIEENIDSREMWERGDTEVSWKEKTIYDRPNLYQEDIHSTYYDMAKDILSFIEKNENLN
jgi:hypothetical protein